MIFKYLFALASFYVFLPISIGAFIYAQGYLQKEIEYDFNAEKDLKDVMHKIERELGFYFSYESTLDIKNPQDIKEPYKGSVESFLAEIFGEQFEFRELPGYIIIRYAPRQMDLDIDMERIPRQLIIKGQVRDKQNQKEIQYASIYDRYSLSSTLTDRAGYFDLKLKQQSELPVWITISKEGYRDTSFVMLPSVYVDGKRGYGSLRYLPEDGSSQALEASFFGRMFIGFRQRFQRINLGGFFAESPVQISITPGLGSQGVFSSQIINNFSLNLLGGYTAGVEGFEMAGIFNINQKKMSGFQSAGIFNMVGGNVKGFQISGGFNSVFHNIYGFQVAGLVNHVKQNASGVQLAGIYNKVDSTAHVQIGGLFNYAKKSKMIQFAGLTNLSNTDAEGLQFAGIYNQSLESARYQISGIVNRSKTVTGFQFSGLINIADDSDYPIGLINIIKNGEKSISLAYDEFSMSQMTFRSGGKKMYGIVGAGITLGSKYPSYAIDLGYGLHWVKKERYTMDLEFVHRVATDFDGILNNITSLKLMHGYRLGEHFKFMIGPTVNFNILDPNEDKNIPGLVIFENKQNYGIYGGHFGWIGGIRYVF